MCFFSKKVNITYVACGSPSTLVSICMFGTNDDKVNI